MGRTLTVSRTSVPPEHVDEYVRTVHALAALGEGRGQRLWLFRSSREPGAFIEFSESSSPLAHRSRASRTGHELELEQRLRGLARYASDAWTVWDEVPPPESDGG